MSTSLDTEKCILSVCHLNSVRCATFQQCCYMHAFLSCNMGRHSIIVSTDSSIEKPHRCMIVDRVFLVTSPDILVKDRLVAQDK